tara:strand:+ start:874 stop:2763 length:1890 start_codon:yes stop_codon:yes gene_type:complete
MVNLFRYKCNWRSFLLLFCALIISFKSFGETVTTGNLLPNANDGVDWNSSSTDQINSANSSGYVTNNSTVNGFDITCTNQSNCGYRYSVGGDFEVTGTSTVTADNIGLTNNSITQSMLDNGITLNSYIDVANCESTEGNCESKGGNNDSHTTTIVLKDSSGNVLSTTTQTRTEVTGFQGNCNGYPGTTTTGITTNCGQYNDRIIYLGVGSNTVDWSWQGSDSNYTNQSRQGPNLLGASLNMTYNNTEFNPIDDDTQEVIEDIDTDIVDIIEDIPEDFNWYEEDLPIFEIPVEEEVYFEDNMDWEEDFYIPFEDIETVYIEDLPPMEEFDMEVFEEMPTIEEVFFEEDYMMEPPPVMMEEIFTEEFEEDFTSFIEETGLEEEFEQFLEEEGITAEEFFEEITEEEFSDELTEESFEEFEEPMEEIATNEESVPEVIEDEKETMEESTESEPIEEEKEVASNETNEESSPKEDEPSSESSEESEVQPESSEEQDGVQPEGREEVDTDNRVATDVAKVESKLKQNLKKIAKQIAKNTKETTQNLSKEDLFFKADNLDSYTDIAFYSAKDVYENTNMGFFLQMDLSPYTGDIYLNTNLDLYTENDPIEVNRVKLINLKTIKNKLLAELEALKQ